MGCPGVGPCLVYDLDLSCTLTPSGSLPDLCLLEGQPVDPVKIETAKLSASQILWAITGRQFSLCEVTIRPCRKGCNDSCCSLENGFPWTPVHLADGSWTNLSCNCKDECSCVSLSEINLPYPVCSVDEVLIDGAIVDPTTYRVDNFKKLVRLGTDVWPSCNSLNLPDSEIGTWSVTLTYGREPPALVLLAAAELAGEIIKSCMGAQCKLPQRLSSITRQGISVSFLDDMSFLDKGLTGMYFVDLAARTYNPNRLMRRPNVSSPDSLNQWRVTTWQDGDPIGPVNDGNIDGGGP